MSSNIALIICIFVIAFLLMRDKKRGEAVSKAIWIPLLYMAVVGSRSVTEWMNLGGPVSISSNVYNEGSPIDRVFFLFLIAAGALALVRRKLNWAILINQNAVLLSFFLYCAVSILWSDYPLVSLKRLIKLIGNVIMALVILTENQPIKAIGVVIRRMAYILLPLSVLFIRYFPDIGRGYHMGSPMFSGVASQKNTLGQTTLIAGVFFCWEMILNWKNIHQKERKLIYQINFIMFPVILWLLYIANSATSTACMVISLFILVIARTRFAKRNTSKLITFGIVTLLFIGIFEFAFDLSEVVIRMLGRDPNLTERVPIWENLMDQGTNPIIGVGYEIFWSSERIYQIGITQSHNGYIDIYLNIGLIGLSLLLWTIVNGGFKVMRRLSVDYEYGMFKLVLILIIVLINWTEATFKPTNNLFVLLMVAILQTQNLKDINDRPPA